MHMILTLRRLKTSIEGTGLLSSIMVLAGGTAFAQIISVLASPILTRLYTPEDFGVLAIYGSFLSVMLVIASLRYELAIPITKDDRTGVSLLWLSTAILVVLSLISGLIVWLFGGELAHWMGAGYPRSVLWLLPMGFFGAGMYQVLSMWAVREKAFARITRTKVSQSVSQVLVQLVLGVAHFGPIGLLLGDISGRASGIGTLSKPIIGRFAGELRSVKWSEVRSVAVRYKDFPLVSVWSGLLNNLGLQVPSIFLAALFGNTVLGMYALSQRLLSIPLNLIGHAVAQVFMREAADLVHEDPRALARLFHKTSSRLFLFSLVPSFMFFMGAPWAFEHVFGHEWRLAGEYARVLTPVFLAQFVLAPVSQIFVVLERQGLQLAWDAIRLAVVAIVFLAGRGQPPLQTVAVYSFVLALMYLGLYAEFWYVLRKLRSRSEEGGAH